MLGIRVPFPLTFAYPCLHWPTGAASCPSTVGVVLCPAIRRSGFRLLLIKEKNDTKSEKNEASDGPI